MNNLNLIAIGYAKRALVAGSREQLRMEKYAKELGQYHLIVFTRKGENLPTSHSSGNLHIHGTNSSTKIGMLFDAYKITRSILKTSQKMSWVISSQDPFETSLVGYFAAKAKNAMHHIQLHGDFYGSTRWEHESSLNRLRARFGLFVLEKASCIRVVSGRIKKSLVAQGISSAKINVLPIAVTLDKFLSIGQKRKYGETEDVTFLYVGRLAHEKNLTLLIKVFAKLCKEREGVYLRIVGDGPEKEGLQILVQKLDIETSVTFVSWTDDISDEYKKADIFVLSSNHEGYALVLIEALASGLPIITTNVGCVGEIVLDNQHGLVFQKDNATELFTCMNKYVIDVGLRNTHAHAGCMQGQKIATNQKQYTTCWKNSFSCS